jgi:pilus assembly protein CpaF
MPPSNSHQDADIPQFVSDAFGNRIYTINALLENIQDQFHEETAGRTDILAELNTPESQREAVIEVVDYVLARESVVLPPKVRQWLVTVMLNDLFYLGPLSSYLQDPTVTEININAPNDCHVRHGFGKLEQVDVVFRDVQHLAGGIERLLATQGIDIEEGDGFIEVGGLFSGRPMRFSLIGPPVMPFFQGQIRLHPPTPLKFDDLAGTISPVALEMIELIVQSGHGLLIVGDNGVGKTSLWSALLPRVDEQSVVALLERTAEIHPAMIPPLVNRDIYDQEGNLVPFESQIEAVLDKGIQTVFLDEIRGEEAGPLWQLLQHSSHPQIITMFRGTGESSRLHSAIGMAIRKKHLTLPQEEIDTVLVERLPFVAVLSHPKPNAAPRLVMLGQWARAESGLLLESLIRWQHDDPQAVRTNIQPCRDLG